MSSFKEFGFILVPAFLILLSLLATRSWLAIFVPVGLLFRTLYGTFLYPEILTPLKKIPSPPGRSILRGHKGPNSTLKRVERVHHWNSTVPNNGLLRIYQSDHQEKLLITNTKALSDVLVINAYDFVKPESVRQRLFFVTGNGLLLSEGEEHRKQRKSLMPAFSFRHVKDLYPVFWSKTRELTDCLKREVEDRNSTGESVVQMREWASCTTFDIIGLTGMDYDFASLRDPDNSLTRQYQLLRPYPSGSEMILGLALSIFSRRFAAKILSRLPTKRMRQMKAASLYIRTHCQKVIQEKQDKLKKGDSDNDVDIITVALKSAVFTNENLVDQMMTFLAAGHGTTSQALQWAVYALCKHEDMQTRLRQEIRSNLPSIGNIKSTISASDLDRLPYLHAFCNEILRFYPSVPSTIRAAVRETTVAGYPIPKGTIFEISPAVINRDPEIWGTNAGIFDPERWMQEGCTNTGGVRNNYGFLTFLHGPRSCIGATFARAELACLVAGLIGSFQMELEIPGQEADFTRRGIGAGPVDGVRTRLKVLDGW